MGTIRFEKFSQKFLLLLTTQRLLTVHFNLFTNYKKYTTLMQRVFYETIISLSVCSGMGPPILRYCTKTKNIRGMPKSVRGYHRPVQRHCVVGKST